jgi:hypothetical protein
MRLLGTKTPLLQFRLDLVFLHAGLMADSNAEVAALAAVVGALVEECRAERDLLERALDASTVMTARKVRSDSAVDKMVLTFGGVARSVAPRVYELFFSSLTPSAVARASIEREVVEVKRMLGEFARLPEDDGLRRGYEGSLRGALASLEAALAAQENANVALTLARSRVAQFKMRCDRERTVLHGKLVALLGDKKLADEYFRPAKESRDVEEGEDDPAPAPPAT